MNWKRRFKRSKCRNHWKLLYAHFEGNVSCSRCSRRSTSHSCTRWRRRFPWNHNPGTPNAYCGEVPSAEPVGACPRQWIALTAEKWYAKIKTSIARSQQPRLRQTGWRHGMSLNTAIDSWIFQKKESISYKISQLFQDCWYYPVIATFFPGMIMVIATGICWSWRAMYCSGDFFL